MHAVKGIGKDHAKFSPVGKFTKRAALCVRATVRVCFGVKLFDMVKRNSLNQCALKSVSI